MRTSCGAVWTTVAAAVIAVPLAAQEIVYTKRTSTEMGGALGDIMRMMPGGGDQEERVQISVPGRTMRTDDGDEQSTIINYATGDITSIDHDERTWMRMNFSQMMGAARDAMAGGQMPGQYQPPPQSELGPESQPMYEAKISVEKTGAVKQLLGYRAEQVVLRVDLIPVRAPEGESLEDMPSHVIVTSAWTAEDFPGNEALQTLTAEMGEQMAGSGDFQALSAAFAQNPALQQAFEENGQELAKLGALPLEQVIAFATVPAGVTYDMESAINGDLGGGGGINIADAARSGLAQAARGRLGGLMGRGRQPEPEPEADTQALGQMVLIRIREVMVSFDQSPLAPGWDQIPEGYQERASPFQRRN